MRPRHFSALIAAALTLIASAALAGPWLPAPGDYYTEFRGGRVDGTTYYNGDSKKLSLPNGGEFEGRRLVSYTELGWKDNLSFFMQVPAVSLTLREHSPEFEATQTGLGDAHLGLRYRLMQGTTAMAVEADWKAPLGYSPNVEPTLGDAQQDVGGRVLFGGPLASQGFFQAGAGYLYRFEDPPDQIFGSADVAYWIGQRFLLSGHYDGEISMSSSDFPGLERSAHMVGPQLLLRVDDALDLFAGTRYVIAGKNAVRSNEFYIGAAFKHTQLGRLQGFLGSSGNSAP